MIWTQVADAFDAAAEGLRTAGVRKPVVGGQKKALTGVAGAVSGFTT